MKPHPSSTTSRNSVRRRFAPVAWALALLGAALAPLPAGASTPCSIELPAVYTVENGKVLDPSGAQDSSAYLQAKLDQLEGNLTNSTGVALIFPAGTFRLNKRLVFDNSGTAIPRGNRGIVVRGCGPDQTTLVVYNNTTNEGGGIEFRLNTNNLGDMSYPQVEDLRLMAAAPNAGAAVSMFPSRTDGTQIYPLMRNVVIGQWGSNSNYFAYGFHGVQCHAGNFDNVVFNGKRGTAPAGTAAGIYYENSYNGRIRDCTISGADIGINWDTVREGGNVWRTTISSVNTGIRIYNPYGVGPSVSGGSILYCTISAVKKGIELTHKLQFSICGNTLTKLSGTTYTHMDIHDLRRSIIADNTLSGCKKNEVGLSLVNDGYYLNQNPPLPASNDKVAISTTVAYNQFVNDASTYNISVGGPEAHNRVLTANLIGNTNNGSPGAIKVLDYGNHTFTDTASARPAAAPQAPFAGANATYFNWHTIRNDIGLAQIIDVTKTVPPAVPNDGIDDLLAIQAAIQAAKLKLNDAAVGTAALYFPAGNYTISNKIALDAGTGSAAANWRRLAIFGDGKAASVITSTSADQSVFVKCPAAAEVRVHNLTINSAAAGVTSAALKVVQTGAIPPAVPGGRSFAMHDVLMERATGTYYFDSAMNGTGWLHPLIRDTRISGQDDYTAAEHAGEKGAYITGGVDFESEGFSVDHFQRAIVLRNAGNITVRGPAGVVTHAYTGLDIDTSGRITVDTAHMKARDKTIVLNHAAEGVLVRNLELLNQDTDGAQDPARTTLELQNCANVSIRDNNFGANGAIDATTENQNRVTIRLVSGVPGVQNYEISGNQFAEFGTGILIPNDAGAASVFNNRFLKYENYGNTEDYTPISVSWSGLDGTDYLQNPLRIEPVIRGSGEILEYRDQAGWPEYFYLW